MTEESDKSPQSLQDAQYVPVAMSMGGSTVPSLLQQTLPQELIARSAVNLSEQQTSVLSISPSNSSSFTFIETTGITAESWQSLPARATVLQQRRLDGGSLSALASERATTVPKAEPSGGEEDDFELVHDGQDEGVPTQASSSAPPASSPVATPATSAAPVPPPSSSVAAEPIPAAPWGGLTVPYVCLLLIVFSVFLPYYKTSKAHTPLDILCSDYLFGSYCPVANSELPVYVLWRRTPLGSSLLNATRHHEPEAFLTVLETFTDRLPLIWILAGILEVFFVIPFLTTRDKASAWQAVPGFHLLGLLWLGYSAWLHSKPCGLDSLGLGFYVGLLGQLLFWFRHANFKCLLMLLPSFVAMTFLFDNYPTTALTVFVVRLALCY